MLEGVTMQEPLVYHLELCGGRKTGYECKN